jgi:hypothetical protein
LLTGGGLLFADVAWLHMRSLALTYGVICGSDAGAAAHCPLCYASVLLLAAGAAAFGLAEAGQRSPLQVRSRS